MKYTAVIVEDEVRSRQFLKSLVDEFCPEVDVTGMAASVEEAVGMINQLKPQLLFLDIEMHTGTGFDILQQISHREFQVIFTTAYDHYAIKAIKFSALDYLLKPIDVQELQTAVQKAIAQLSGNETQKPLEMLLQNMLRTAAGQDYTISLSTSEGMEFVPIRQIMRLEASGPYTTFFLKDQRKIMVSKNLKEYEILLGDHEFYRLHNSHIVNLREVRKVVKTDGGYAVMNDDSMIAISPKKKEEFLLLLSNRTVK